ncbi:SGNH/GDSL hydrolase family protein [Ornatilinea apprima]|uniref:SGNH/GDSL hydrolase family protein n=1 Tax=Ornatilinea apprima TaxID=1134406 RepID=UPI0009ECA74B|nr:SGNH/GDSL hydrolase family protein [Ornatilinea apprima]
MKPGYLRLFGVLLMAALLSACAAPTPPDDDAARLLALGDSYTVGEGLPAEQSWPAQLSRALEAEDIAVGELRVIARTGWTSEALLSALQEADPQGTYDLVTVMVGVNDQFNSLSIDAYRANLRALIERAVILAGGDAARVIVLSIPDWSASPAGAQFAAQRVPVEVARFNQVCQEEAQRAGTRYVDVTPLSLQMSEREDYSAPDGLHPSGEQYRARVDLILPEARAALGGLDE